MDLEKLKKDYEEVKDISMKVFDTDINPIRCHEMAYLISQGLKQKGYPTEIQDGYFQDRMEHSWVRINDGKSWGFNKYVFVHVFFNPYSFISSKPIYTSKIVTDRKLQRRQFKKTKIQYELAEGSEDLATRLFPASKEYSTSNHNN